ncbi:sensor histidine kinase [Nocardioides dilutus]
MPVAVLVDPPDLLRHERERIARDLLAVALGQLSGLGFELSSIRQLPALSDGGGLVDERIRTVIEALDSLSRELRNMVFDILGRNDLDLDTDTALGVLLDHTATQMDAEVDLSVDGQAPPEAAC